MKLMIVDDSPPFLQALGAILKAAGYTDLILMESASAAFSFLKTAVHNPVATPVDLILMDINMPEMNGIDAVRAIKSDAHLQDIPIVMVSVLDDEEGIEEAFSAGAIDYISKPIKKLELKARVRSVLRMKEEMDSRKKNQMELEEANRMLRRLSTMDGLTGVANRRFFDEYFLREWRRCMREQIPISLIMIDIDHFKSYNDHYGHLGGDDCLRQVSATLEMSLRRPGDFLARYGGEEFAALLPGTKASGAVHVANTMIRQLAEKRLPHLASAVSDCVTVSLGVASLVPDTAKQPEALVSAADQALYSAKKAGRNQVFLAASPL